MATEEYPDIQTEEDNDIADVMAILAAMRLKQLAEKQSCDEIPAVEAGEIE